MSGLAVPESVDRTLVAIGELLAERGYAPTLREIQASARLSSTSVVAYHLSWLRRQGLVTFEPGLTRTLRLTEAGWQRATGASGSRLVPGECEWCGGTGVRVYSERAADRMQKEPCEPCGGTGRTVELGVAG